MADLDRMLADARARRDHHARITAHHLAASGRGTDRAELRKAFEAATAFEYANAEYQGLLTEAGRQSGARP